LSKAICYVRVSTEEQVLEGVSLNAQRERLVAYCALKGLQIVEVIADEGISASKALDIRPGGKRVVDLLKRKEIKHVVALKLDRLFRNAEDALRNTSAWERKGLSLHLVDLGGQSIDSGTAVGRMMLTMLAAFAEFERNLVSERTVAALAYKRRHLQVFNHVPFGFSQAGGRLVPNEAEIAVVGEIRGWREAGATFRAIAARLNAQHVPSKKGGVWYASTVQNVLGVHARRSGEQNLMSA
jgi:DNA invertase Pin-like site-specific DNA recombinase